MPKVRQALLLASLLLLLAAFPFGPLFPWSPWKPGYERLSLTRADIFYPAGTTPKDVYRSVDVYISGAERALQLTANKHLTVIVTKDWDHFQRLLPHLRSRGLGAVTLATGTIIYVTPRLDERGFDHGEFLRHEINHAVMHQNQGVLDAYRMNELPWLLEGLAVSYGDQKAYLSREQFLIRARRQPDLLPVIDPSLRQAGMDMRFAYPVWRYFVEYLIDHYDRARFQGFLRACMDDPRQWRDHFQHSFGEPLERAVRQYADSLPAPAP
jgi:hypothetical protein